MTYEGHCAGGPMDGRAFVGEGSSGVIFIDKPSGLAHIYDLARLDPPDACLWQYRITRSLDINRAVNTAFDPAWDVRSLPEVSDG